LSDIPSSTAFADFHTKENFEHAWIYVRNSNHHAVKDHLGLSVYSSQLNIHLQLLLENIQEGYKPNDVEKIYQPKRDGSLRCDSFLSIDDRIIYQALGNVIARRTYEEIELFANQSVFAHIPYKDNPNYFLRFAFPFRQNLPDNKIIEKKPTKGQYAQFRIKVMSEFGNFLSRFPQPFGVKTDIANFYSSINHNRLRQILSDKGFDEDFLKILDSLLTKCSSSPYAQGIPIGYETSDILSTLYLFSLDDELKQAGFTHVRFVDDFYIFAQSREKVKEALSLFDNHIENLHIQRNIAKTEIFCLTLEKQTEIEAKLSVPLYGFDNPDDDDTHEVTAIKQDFLLERFNSYHVSCPNCGDNIQDKIPNPSDIAFILYRASFQNDDLRNIAICMLDYFPFYSFHITRYLSANYPQDKEIIKVLYDTLASDYIPTTVRVNCFKSLFRLIQPRDILDFAIKFFQNKDNWYFKYRIIELVSSHFFKDKEFFDFIYSVAKNEKHSNVRAIALSKSFNFAMESKNDDLIIDIIQRAISDKEEFINKLGIYMIRRKISIIKRLNLSLLDKKLRESFQIQSIDNSQNFSRFVTLFKTVFKFDLYKDFPIEGFFGNANDATQIMLNIVDRMEKDFSGLIDNIDSLTKTFLFSYAKYLNKEIREPNEEFKLETIVNNYFYDDSIIHENTAQLVLLLGKSNHHEKLRNSVLEKISTLLFYCINYIHMVEYGKPMRKDKRNQIFISYAHKDEQSWIEKIKKSLKQSFRDTDIPIWDDTQIKTGENWHNKIQEAISMAKVAILLLSIEFLASEYIQNNELIPIFEAHKNNEIIIAWIPIKHSNWDSPKYPFRSIKSLVDNPEIPLSSRSSTEQDEQFVQIAKKVHSLFYGEKDG